MSWDADAAATWDQLVSDLLEQHGFQVDDTGTVYGEVSYVDSAGAARFARVEVHRSDAFPFRPPRVQPWDGSGTRSWHQERSGALCLYGTEGNSDWPWLDAAELVARIAEWYSRDAKQWIADAPDLDLERYLPAADFPALVLYRELDSLAGRPVRLKRRGHADVFEVVGAGVRPAGKKMDKSVIYGHVVNLGPLPRPFHNWDELLPLLRDAGIGIARSIQQQRVQLLLVRYQRGHLSSVAALTVQPASAGIDLAAVESADDGEATRALRSGPTAELLRDRAVAVVGIGAVGGFVADMLIRDGVGTMTLVDGERLRPGNCVRHYLDYSFIGANKARAVRSALISRQEVPGERVRFRDHHLLDGQEAAELLSAHDLVINASASDVSTGLLNHLAIDAGTPVLSVHLERAGELAVVHRRPLPAGRENYGLASDPVVRPNPGQEGGCGEPVATSRSDAVVSAASHVVGMAVDGLTGSFDDVPATQVTVLAAQIDEPFTKIATLRW